MSSKERILAVENKVAGIRKKLSRGNRSSMVLGGVLLVLVMGYFVYGYREINSVLNAKTIVDVSQSMLEENIPKIKQTVQSEVERNAPIWAESLSQQAVDALPGVREQLVSYTVSETDELIAQTVRLGDEEINRFITDNRDEIQQAITELENNQDASAEMLAVFEKGLSDVLQADFERDSKEILAYSQMMEEKMTRLFEGKNLEPGESLERQALMVLRRLQLSELKE